VLDKQFGVLIHGAGWVSTQHIAAFTKNPHTRVVAISSRKLASAQQRAAEAGLDDVTCYDDYDKALQHPGVDIVAVCTPQHVHCDNVVKAADAGRHIVIEKAAAISMDELHTMRDAVHKAGVKTVVSFVLRWNPLFITLKRMIQDDAFGRIFCVETDYLSYAGNWWGGFPEGRRKDWGVSAMLVAGCHAIDSLRWFASNDEHKGAKPVEVFGYRSGIRGDSTHQFNPLTNSWQQGDALEYEGLEMLLVRFDNGVIGKVSVNFDYIGPYSFPIRVFGDKGTIRDDRIWSQKVATQNDWVTIPAIRPDSSDVAHHPFQAQNDHFVDCLLNDVESHCNLDDAIVTHEVAFAAQQCYQTNQPVRLPLASLSDNRYRKPITWTTSCTPNSA